MLVPYWLALGLMVLIPLAIIVLGLLAAKPLGERRPRVAALIRWAGLIGAVALLFVGGSASYHVWVVDDEGYRRYLLFGSQATTATLDGRPIPVAVGEGLAVSLVVNATRGDLVVESAQYGGVNLSSERPLPFKPGQVQTCGFTINGVGDPPRTAQVQDKSPVALHHYVRRFR